MQSMNKYADQRPPAEGMASDIFQMPWRNVANLTIHLCSSGLPPIQSYRNGARVLLDL